MKIMHVINDLGVGGAEKMLLDIVVRQAAIEGNEITLLTLGSVSDYKRKFLTESGVNVICLDKHRFNPLIIISILYYSRNVDVVHAHLFPALYFVSLIKRFNRNKKLIITEHNTHNSRRNYKLLYYVERFVYGAYEHVICISDSVKSNLCQWIGVNTPASVIYNGIVLDDYKCDEYAIPRHDASVHILMISSFSRQKNQDCLVRALEKLPSNFKVRFIGDGFRIDEVKSLVNELDLQHRVEFLGVRRDIPAQIAKVNFIVQSSHWEGFGLTALEGMASSKPVLASDVAGLSQVVSGAGVLFEPDNEVDLANKMLSLYNSEEKYLQTSKNGFARAQKYSIESLVNSYQDIYIKSCK